MLKISKLADYAIVIMNELAAQKGQFLSASQLASLTHVSEATASKLLKSLAKSELLQSQMGAQGGYSLINDPKDINLAQIITAIEGEIALTECDKHNSCCNMQKTCTVSSNWQRIGAAIRNALAEISLADMQQPIPQAVIELKMIRNIKRL